MNQLISIRDFPASWIRTYHSTISLSQTSPVARLPIIVFTGSIAPNFVISSLKGTRTHHYARRYQLLLRASGFPVQSGGSQREADTTSIARALHGPVVYMAHGVPGFKSHLPHYGDSRRKYSPIGTIMSNFSDQPISAGRTVEGQSFAIHASFAERIECTQQPYDATLPRRYTYTRGETKTRF